MAAAERVGHLVLHGVRGQREQRRGARRDLGAHLVDEVVVDPDVRHRAGERPGRGADDETEQGDEEDQPEEQAPEAAAEGAAARYAGTFLVAVGVFPSSALITVSPPSPLFFFLL